MIGLLPEWAKPMVAACAVKAPAELPPSDLLNLHHYFSASQFDSLHLVFSVSVLSPASLTMAASKGGLQSFSQLKPCPRPRIHAPQWPLRLASRKMGHLATFKVPTVNNEPNVRSPAFPAQLHPALTF